MSEFCPLSNGGRVIEGERHCYDNPRGGTITLPEACRKQCEELWAQAIQNRQTVGEYDLYENHENCEGELEHSHSALIALGKTAERHYVLVDQCLEHGEEVGEQGYVFQCPHNKSKIN